MYSYEIDQLLKNKSYIINANDYVKICNTSPQIDKIKYESFGNYFYIRTKDGYSWNFSVVSK